MRTLLLNPPKQCNWWSFACDNESLLYGNVRDAAIDEIWYPAKAERLRRNARKHICPRCAVICNTSFSLRYEFFYFTRFLLMTVVKRFLGASGR